MKEKREGWFARKWRQFKLEMDPFYCDHHGRIEEASVYYTHHYGPGEEPPYDWR